MLRRRGRGTEGEQYNFDFGGGIKMRYRSYSSGNLTAQQGELEILFNKRVTSKELKKAFKHLEDLGIDAKITDPIDIELLYLHKTAYASKEVLNNDYKAMIEALDRTNATKEQRLAKLRQYWNSKLGVPDVTRLPDYNPMGTYQDAFRLPGKRAGYRYQWRFDISDADFDREMGDYSLYHSIEYGGNRRSMAEFLDEVLQKNVAMIATTEKMRSGIPIGGESPVQDMNTGGADYFFTRIFKRSNRVGIWFKPKLLKRTDAISYSSDMYGDIRGGNVLNYRGSNFDEWKNYAEYGGNETILKHSVMVVDNLDQIVVRSRVEKDQIIEVFHKHNIRTLPDGRRVADIVKVH